MTNYDVLNVIKDQKLVSPSLFEILYGETEEEQLDTLLSSERIAADV